MVIYGIASCMSYLHSKGMIHRDLKPENFLLDNYLFPKLANFCYTKDTNKKNESQSGNELIGIPKYFAPEIFEKEEYSKSSDVYAFSLILYEIVSGEKPFSGNTIYQIMKKVVNGDSPSLNESIPLCYRHLIESCWSQNPLNRMSFDQIIHELTANIEFLKDGVDNKVFQHYIKYIDDYLRRYDESHEILKIEDYFSNIDKTFQKVDLISIRKVHFKNRKFVYNYPKDNLSHYSKQSKIGEGSFGVIYKVTQCASMNFCAAKISKKQIYEMDDDEFTSLNREVEIIHKLNSFCILKFIDFSVKNFENEDYPVVITEYLPDGSLKDIINKERAGLSDPKWNNTTKLINIYGIAYGMAYLHYNNIIHRDLKPDNILLDDDLHPKIADFGLSRDLSNDENNEQCIAYKLKGTPMYCSPEILEDLNNTKAGDVYAFAFIVYEIITNQVPFQNICFFALLKKIFNKERPKFDFPIPSCYRSLIERCWSQNPNDRPSFDEILDDLECNQDFILDDIDENIYYSYAKSINKKNRYRYNKFQMNDEIKKNKSSKNDNINSQTKKSDIDSQLNKNESMKVKEDNNSNIGSQKNQNDSMKIKECDSSNIDLQQNQKESLKITENNSSNIDLQQNQKSSFNCFNGIENQIF